MSDLRPNGVSIELGGVERHFLFTLNVIDEIQSHYDMTVFDALKKLSDEEEQSSKLRFFVKTLLNDEVEREKWKNPNCDLELIDEKQAGWLISIDNIREVTVAIFNAYKISVPNPEDEDPNQTSEQQSS